MTEPNDGPTPTEMVAAADARHAARIAGAFPGPVGARPVEDRDLPDPSLCECCGAPPLTVEDVKRIQRRRKAETDPNHWSVGGPGERTLYEGDRFVGSTVDPADAVNLAAAANLARHWAPRG